MVRRAPPVVDTVGRWAVLKPPITSQTFSRMAAQKNLLSRLWH